MVHHLYINEVLFETYTKISDVFHAFSNWKEMGLDVRIAFNIQSLNINYSQYSHEIHSTVRSHSLIERRP